MAKVLYIDARIQKKDVGLSSRETPVEIEVPYVASPSADAGGQLQQIQIPASSEVEIPRNLVPVVRGLVIKVVTSNMYVDLRLEADPTVSHQIDSLFIWTIPAGNNPAIIRIVNPDPALAVDVEVFLTGANS